RKAPHVVQERHDGATLSWHRRPRSQSARRLRNTRLPLIGAARSPLCLDPPSDDATSAAVVAAIRSTDADPMNRPPCDEAVAREMESVAASGFFSAACPSYAIAPRQTGRTPARGGGPLRHQVAHTVHQVVRRLRL